MDKSYTLPTFGIPQWYYTNNQDNKPTTDDATAVKNDMFAIAKIRYGLAQNTTFKNILI